ncbi:Ltp family lipoprotein [Enterococcus faecalis]|uniref:Ltp family lipoprotein n=1 Tax=Enterococcus faecalis TaxID=1351 RepID=UPI00217FE62C|nr:Ltp family lipoprotein [Enterococcus faecalis]MDG0920888.1 Ltp family lipoprotein [Enterococcus faecalis]
MKKRNIFFLLLTCIFLVACNSKLDKSDLDSYYTSLVDSYCDGLIPIYEEDLSDSKAKKNYENTLNELEKLQKKYSNKESEFKKYFKAIKKLNMGMIKEYKGLVKAKSNKDLAYDDGVLMQDIANKYRDGKTTDKQEYLSQLIENSETQGETENNNTYTSDMYDESPSNNSVSDSYTTPSSNVSFEDANALAKAHQYSTTMHMSKAAIYDQLTSEYGEKFSAKSAQYAIDNMVADFNANALAKAKEYQQSMAMSAEEIREQLTSEYGEKFTPEEADYAIQHLND